MSEYSAVIIEDNDDIGRIYSFALERVGFTTRWAQDGISGLEILRTSLPDLLILDLHLPGMSGEAILQTIRADEQLKNLRVLVVSADSEMARYLFQADLVLLKPATPSQIQSFATRLVRLPSSHASTKAI